MDPEIEENIIKFDKIVRELEKYNIIFIGLVDGLVQTTHKHNTNRVLNQNPMWWQNATEEQIIDSVLKTFSKEINGE